MKMSHPSPINDHASASSTTFARNVVRVTVHERVARLLTFATEAEWMLMPVGEPVANGGIIPRDQHLFPPKSGK